VSGAESSRPQAVQDEPRPWLRTTLRRSRPTLSVTQAIGILLPASGGVLRRIHGGSIGRRVMNASRMAMYHLAAARSRRVPAARREPAAARPEGRALPDFTYIICTNPRSGSWLLSDGLASTSIAGNPREWFNILEERKYRAQWRMEHSSDLSFAQYLRLVAADSAGRNGVSGLKLHYYQFAQLPGMFESVPGCRALSPAGLLAKAFPRARYIWLTRGDKARQAISLSLASRTGEWWRIGADGPPGSGADVTGPGFDPAAVLDLERQLAGHDESWQGFFRDNRITPLVVQYEDLAADYAGTVRGVLRWLGAAGDGAVVPPSRLRRQSDERSELWLERYTAFKETAAARRPAAAPGGAAGPVTGRIEQPGDWVPGPWRQWIGQSRALGVGDDEMAAVLVRNGYSQAAASAAVGQARDDDYLAGAVRAQQRLQRGASMLNLLGDLARLDSRLGTIERCAAPTRDVFRDRYYASNRPVILTGLMSGWPAITRWTPEYLKSAAGDQAVEVMTGRDGDPGYELNGHAHRREMRFADYVDLVHSGRVTNDYYLVANNGFFGRPGTQSLAGDCPAFPPYLQPAPDGQHRFFWYGPGGTVTPLHRDTCNIMIAQVAGRKRYRLIPAAQSRCVYNTAGVFSDVDAADPDLAKYPDFRDATITEFVLQPGEVLFMPVGWWHHVEALDVSMSVTFTSFVFPNHFSWER
jgi:LPS sulfotransferase NodH